MVLVAGRFGGVRSVTADERALLARLAEGDRNAVAALYARFGRPLFAYAKALTADETVAEEIVQDTFVAAWRSADRFEGRSTVATWLFGIARRQARDRMRRVAPARDSLDALAEMPSDGPDPEAAALAAASRDELAAALELIPDGDREVLILAFAHELSGPEIAGVLGVPEGTVKSRLFHARRRLRLQLAGREI